MGENALIVLNPETDNIETPVSPHEPTPTNATPSTTSDADIDPSANDETSDFASVSDGADEKPADTADDAQDCADEKPADTADDAQTQDGEKEHKGSKPVKKGKKPPKPPKKKKKKSTLRLFVGLLIKIAVIALAVWALFTFILGVNIHYGNNMHPSVRDGDLVITYRLERPYINAAVMYEHDGKMMIGRVIAMPGSTIDIADNGVFTVNNYVPTEEIFYPTYPAENSSIQYPYTVEPGKVFILNDFRTDTYDSRTFGAVDIDDLKGTLLLTLRRRGF